MISFNFNTRKKLIQKLFDLAFEGNIEKMILTPFNIIEDNKIYMFLRRF